MPAREVNQLFVDRLSSDAAMPPYIETVNSRPVQTPKADSEWMTAEYDYSGIDRITIGSPALYREQGTVTVVGMVPSGSGLDRAMELAERIRDLFWGYYTESIRIDEVGSGVVYKPDSGNFFLIRVPVPYVFDFYR